MSVSVEREFIIAILLLVEEVGCLFQSLAAQVSVFNCLDKAIKIQIIVLGIMKAVSDQSFLLHKLCVLILEHLATGIVDGLHAFHLLMQSLSCWKTFRLIQQVDSRRKRLL